MAVSKNKRVRVVIAGAGFAGLRLARKLNGHKTFDVTLIDRYNYHQFQPLFYQVATAGLDASNISFPLRKAFQGSENVHVRMTDIKRINAADNVLETDAGPFEYDVLVIATGTDTNFFGNKDMAANALPMKSTVEAIQLRHRVLKNFEDALLTDDATEKKRLMNVVIVGGGPTGVELAGAIADMKRFVLPKDYPELDFSKMHVILLEGGPRLLGAMSEKSSKDSSRYLKRLGVEVHTGTQLESYDGQTAVLKGGKEIETHLLIWAAGVAGNVPAGIDKSLIAKGNRIITDSGCLVKNSENIYAIGDIAFTEGDPNYPNAHPQLAPVATQQADLLAHNLRADFEKQNGKKKAFAYRDKGVMATVGRKLAVVDIPKPKLHLNGVIAWLIWMFLHLMLIVGVKNRLSIFSNWVYKYFTKDQNLRLIFKVTYSERRKKQVSPANIS